MFRQGGPLQTQTSHTSQRCALQCTAVQGCSCLPADVGWQLSCKSHCMTCCMAVLHVAVHHVRPHANMGCGLQQLEA